MISVQQYNLDRIVQDASVIQYELNTLQSPLYKEVSQLIDNLLGALKETRLECECNRYMIQYLTTRLCGIGKELLILKNVDVHKVP